MTTGVELTPGRAIGIDEIEAIVAGASFYACGGGGSLVEGRILTSAVAGRLGRSSLGVVALDELPDAARVAVPLAFARPRVGASLGAATAAFEQLGARTGGPLDAVLPADLGVVSVLTAFAVAADLGVPVVDAGGGIRSAARLEHTTWAAAGVLPELAVVSDGHEHVTLQSDSIVVADRSIHLLAGSETFGGAAAGATWAMRAPTARRASVPGILRDALTAGRAIDAAAHEGGDAIGQLVGLVDGAVLVGRGRVASVTLSLHERVEHLEVRIDTARGSIDVLSTDGHLQLRLDGKPIVGAPDLISVLTPGGLGCTPHDLAIPAMEGQMVAVIATPAPTNVPAVDPLSYADDHRLLGGNGEPISFAAS